MKIALLLSGHLRYFDICRCSLYENLINQNEVDIFIHTWKDRDVSRHKNIKMEYNERVIDELRISPNIKNVIVDDYDEFKHQFINKPFPERLASMYYKVYKSFGMIEDKYDIVIRSRPDLYYNSTIPIINDGCMYIPSGIPSPRVELLHSDYKHLPPHVLNEGTVGVDSFFMAKPSDNSTGLVDVFAYSNYSNMKIYCNLYNSIDGHFEEYRRSSFNPEYILKYYLSVNNTNIKRFDHEINIFRNWGYL